MVRVATITKLLMLFALVAANTESFAAEECKAEQGVVVPKLVSDLVSVKCEQNGWTLTGTEKFVWFNPMGEGPSQFPHLNAGKSGFGAFVDLKARVLTKQQATAAYVGPLQEGRPDGPPDTSIEVSAKSEDGSIQRVFLFRHAPDTTHGYLCDPECRPEEPFLTLPFGMM